MSQTNSTPMQQLNQIDMNEVFAMAQTLVSTQTTKPTLKDKLKSRKFWISVAGVASGVCGILNADGNTTAMVIFTILQIVSIVVYCLAEGTIDATRAKQIAEAATILIDMIGGSVNPEDYVNDNLGISTCTTDTQPGMIGYNAPVKSAPTATQDEKIPAEFRA